MLCFERKKIYLSSKTIIIIGDSLKDLKRKNSNKAILRATNKVLDSKHFTHKQP